MFLYLVFYILFVITYKFILQSFRLQFSKPPSHACSDYCVKPKVAKYENLVGETLEKLSIQINLERSVPL
jgi:hypothetical protein